MSLSPDVMNDLMVLYISGEASPGTRKLVEEYAALHADYAALLRAAGQTLPVPPAQSNKEMETLKMIRKFILLRSLFIGGGILFTMMPLTTVWRNGEVTFLLYRDVPGLGLAFWSIAAASWVACYVMHRAIRRSGL